MNKIITTLLLITTTLLTPKTSSLYCALEDNFLSLIKEYQFFESFEIETEDGYLLKVFRVRALSDEIGKPILAIHGIVDCSDSWVLNEKGSIGKNLLDQGYDLWFMNSRGNKYSCYHKNLDNLSDEFWDFSFQDMAEYDLKAVLEYVFEETKQKVTVLGHSQGTSQVFAGLSRNLVLQSKVEKFIAFAPIVYLVGLKDEKSLFYYLSTHNYIKLLHLFHIERLGEKKFMQNNFEKYALKFFCYVYKFLCDWILELVDGDPEVDDMEQMPHFLLHLPARSSSRCFEHYAQLIKNNDSQFKYFDFGEKRNLLEYNSKEAPVVDISNIKIPVYIYYSDKDELSTVSNMELIKEKLPNAKFRFFKDYGHLTYFWGKHPTRLLAMVAFDVKEEIKETEI